jgi:hypothetical protein
MQDNKESIIKFSEDENKEIKIASEILGFLSVRDEVTTDIIEWARASFKEIISELKTYYEDYERKFDCKFQSWQNKHAEHRRKLPDLPINILNEKLTEIDMNYITKFMENHCLKIATINDKWSTTKDTKYNKEFKLEDESSVPEEQRELFSRLFNSAKQHFLQCVIVISNCLFSLKTTAIDLEKQWKSVLDRNVIFELSWITETVKNYTKSLNIEEQELEVCIKKIMEQNSLEYLEETSDYPKYILDEAEKIVNKNKNDNNDVVELLNILTCTFGGLSTAVMHGLERFPR